MEGFGNWEVNRKPKKMSPYVKVVKKNVAMYPYSLNSLRHRVKSIYSSPLSYRSKLIKYDQLFYPVSNSVKICHVKTFGNVF